MILRTCGWAIISAVKAGAVSLDIEMKLSTPGGNPASWKSSTTIAWLLGLYSDDLSTTVFPHRIGNPTARIDNANAPFHGAMANLQYDSLT